MLRRDLLERAVAFWRSGMHASGTISWAAYLAAPREPMGVEEDVRAACRRSDYVAAADLVEYAILPSLPPATSAPEA